MSELKELIAELCPDGVEYRKLGEVCEILDSQRKPISKGRREAGEYPYYGANGIQDYVANYIFDGIFLLVGEDGSVINKDNSPVLNWATGKIWVNNHAHVLREKSNCSLRYIYYVLQTQDVSKIVRGTPPKINQENLRNIEIPVPPREVQEEVVRILDAFSQYAAQLQAELQARKEQYEHYRNALLTFDKSDRGGCRTEVKWLKMSEVCDFVNGFAFKSSAFRESGERIIRITNIDGAHVNIDDVKYFLKSDYKNDLNGFMVTKGDILIAMSGATTGKIGCYSSDEVSYINQRVGKFVPKKEKLKNRFLYHFLQTKTEYLYLLAGGGAQPNLSSNKLMDTLEIPIPPLSEQERIVSILDKFETLVNDLSEGLPAEIEAVQQRYEYWRDRLLSFRRVSICNG